MIVTLARATFSGSSPRSCHGGIWRDESSPGTLHAAIFEVPPHPHAPTCAWSAYRTRRDSEGQRQLEQAMVKAALSLSIVPENFVRTTESARDRSMPDPFFRPT